MIEVMDKNSGNKIMVMLFGKISYQEESYAIYCIRRGQEEANVFVSRLVKNSEGFAFDDSFVNGEKEVMERMIQKLLNQVPILELEQDGFSLSSEMSLSEGLSFDIEKCYVTTVPKKLIKDCMVYYGLVTKHLFDSPLIEVQEEKVFNKGFVSNIALIVFGIVVFLFCVVIIGEVFLG